MSNPGQNEFNNAYSCISYFGKRSFDQYRSNVFHIVTEDYARDKGLTADELVAWWLYEDFSALRSRLDQEVGLDDPPDNNSSRLSMDQLAQNQLDFFNDLLLRNEGDITRGVEYRLRYVTNRIFFPRYSRKYAVMNMVASFGLVALGFTMSERNAKYKVGIIDTEIMNMIHNQVKDQLFHELSRFLESLDISLYREFLRVFEATNTDLKVDDTSLSNMIKSRNLTPVSYLRNLLLFAQNLYSAKVKLMADPDSSVQELPYPFPSPFPA